MNIDNFHEENSDQDILEPSPFMKVHYPTTDNDSSDENMASILFGNTNNINETMDHNTTNIDDNKQNDYNIVQTTEKWFEDTIDVIFEQHFERFNSVMTIPNEHDTLQTQTENIHKQHLLFWKSLKHQKRYNKLFTKWISKCTEQIDNESIDINDLQIGSAALIQNYNERWWLQRVVKRGKNWYHNEQLQELNEFMHHIRQYAINTNNILDPDYLFSLIDKDFFLAKTKDQWETWCAKSMRWILDFMITHVLEYFRRDGEIIYVFINNIWKEIKKTEAPYSIFSTCLFNLVDKILELNEYPTSTKSLNTATGFNGKFDIWVWERFVTAIPEANINEFNTNRFIFIDKSEQTYSYLLSTAQNEALPIHGAIRDKTTKVIPTKYKPNAEVVMRIVISLKVISNNIKKIEKWFLIWCSYMISPYKFKYVLFLQSLGPDSGKTSFCNQLQSMAGRIIRELNLKSLRVKNANTAHDESAAYAMEAHGNIIKEFSSSPSNPIEAGEFKSLTGETSAAKRRMYKYIKEKPRMATILIPTNQKTFYFSENNSAVWDKILVLQINSKFSEDRNEVNNETVFLKQSNVLTTLQHNNKANEYLLRLLVESRCSIDNDEWIQKANIPKHILDHSFGAHCVQPEMYQKKNKKLYGFLHTYCKPWQNNNERSTIQYAHKQPENTATDTQIIEWAMNQCFPKTKKEDAQSWSDLKELYTPYIKYILRTRIKHCLVHNWKDNEMERYFFLNM